VYQHAEYACPLDHKINFVRNSWYKVVLPFSTNSDLRFRFIRFHTNGVRNGRLLEIMDYVASTVSYKYVTINLEKKVTIVTAVVDNIKFFNHLTAD
jgi:acyl-coenzyme A thioesterase 9